MLRKAVTSLDVTTKVTLGVLALASGVYTYLGVREEGESFLQTYRRVGVAPFKEKLYAVD